LTGAVLWLIIDKECVRLLKKEEAYIKQGEKNE
jgi:hypothetical protein